MTQLYTRLLSMAALLAATACAGPYRVGIINVLEGEEADCTLTFNDSDGIEVSEVVPPGMTQRYDVPVGKMPDTTDITVHKVTCVSNGEDAWSASLMPGDSVYDEPLYLIGYISYKGEYVVDDAVEAGWYWEHTE